MICNKYICKFGLKVGIYIVYTYISEKDSKTFFSHCQTHSVQNREREFSFQMYTSSVFGRTSAVSVQTVSQETCRPVTCVGSSLSIWWYRFGSGSVGPEASKVVRIEILCMGGSR